jgi:hypothetical protein
MSSIAVIVAASALLAGAALAHGVSDEQATALIEGGHLAYVKAGAIHMLTGYDHLLFLFGVMFFLTTFPDILKFITAFTLGHSVTLVSATLLGIKANYFLIDAVIAVSVIYKGFENLDGFRRWIGLNSPNLLVMVFGFGLIHGFGLSTRLQQLPLPTEGLVTRILAFNLGVELGQVAALVAMAWLLALVREDAKDIGPFTRVSNAGLMAAGAFLFLMQMHGYAHTSNPHDFGFNRDDHVHHHDEMERFARETRETLMPRD